MIYMQVLKHILSEGNVPGANPGAVKEMLQEIQLLEKKAEVTDKILMLKNSAIQIEFCPEHGRTFSGAIFSEDKRVFEHTIQDAKHIEEVLNFLLKHEAEKARLAQMNAKVEAAKAQQLDFTPPGNPHHVEAVLKEERRQGKTLGEIVAEEVKKQLSGLPDGTIVG